MANKKDLRIVGFVPEYFRCCGSHVVCYARKISDFNCVIIFLGQSYLFNEGVNEQRLDPF